MIKKILPVALCASAYLSAAPQEISAWNTGPLLSPSYTCVSAGGYNIEPYIYATTIYGNYDASWKTVSQTNFIQTYSYTLIQVGITNHFNVSISPQFFYQQQGNYSTANIGDLPLEAFFCPLDETDTRPGILIGVKASVPLGKYRRLSPDGSTIEAIGAGSWRPAVSIIAGKQIHFSGVHFLTVRFYFSPQFRNKFPVQGFHSYGGGVDTKGTIAMGTQYTFIGSFEYAFSRHGVFSFDFQYQHNNKITFKGSQGFTDHTRTIQAANGVPSSEQFSIAPALEYNFNENVGFIGGLWFSIAGRNTQAFVSPTFALNIEY
jgi:hypothetical protein